MLKTPFFKLLHECCKRPFTGSLFSEEEQYRCNQKGDPKLQLWIEEYALNKVQMWRKGNAANLTHKYTGIKIRFIAFNS